VCGMTLMMKMMEIMMKWMLVFIIMIVVVVVSGTIPEPRMLESKEMEGEVLSNGWGPFDWFSNDYYLGIDEARKQMKVSTYVYQMCSNLIQLTPHSLYFSLSLLLLIKRKYLMIRHSIHFDDDYDDSDDDVCDDDDDVSDVNDVNDDNDRHCPATVKIFKEGWEAGIDLDMIILSRQFIMVNVDGMVRWVYLIVGDSTSDVLMCTNPPCVQKRKVSFLGNLLTKKCVQKLSLFILMGK